MQIITQNMNNELKVYEKQHVSHLNYKICESVAADANLVIQSSMTFVFGNQFLSHLKHSANEWNGQHFSVFNLEIVLMRF